MTTLIQVELDVAAARESGQEPRLVARCDAGCYDASSPAHTCRCACGGANHGVGVDQADRNVHRFRDRRRSRSPDVRREQGLPIGTLQDVARRDVYSPPMRLEAWPSIYRVFYFPRPRQLELFE